MVCFVFCRIERCVITRNEVDEVISAIKTGKISDFYEIFSKNREKFSKRS